MITPDFVKSLEMQEIVDKLKEAGFEKLMDCLMNERSCFTKRNQRLNKSAVCRKMKCGFRELEIDLAKMRNIMIEKFSFEEERAE